MSAKGKGRGTGGKRGGREGTHQPDEGGDVWLTHDGEGGHGPNVEEPADEDIILRKRGREGGREGGRGGNLREKETDTAQPSTGTRSIHPSLTRSRPPPSLPPFLLLSLLTFLPSSLPPSLPPYLPTSLPDGHTVREKPDGNLECLGESLGEGEEG